MSEFLTKDANGNLVTHSSVPTGTILYTAGAVAPAGFLACDGAAVSRTAYPELFSVLGTVWGAGNGSTTFNLPDARNRFPRAAASGLAVGVTQEDAIRNIVGTIATNYNYNSTPFNVDILTTGAFYKIEHPYGARPDFPAGQSISIGFDASRVVPTADENRPKSIVFSAYIKY